MAMVLCSSDLFFFDLGTIEKSSEAEEEVYETINISKIKAQTPNLRVSPFEREFRKVNFVC